MPSASVRPRRRVLAHAAALVTTSIVTTSLFTGPANAQSRESVLPPVTVQAPEQARPATPRPQRRSAAAGNARVRTATPAASAAPAPEAATAGARGPALTVLTVQQALADIQQTPGGVALVPANAYRNSTVSNTIKDIHDYVPGVFAQPKWGDDTRL